MSKQTGKMQERETSLDRNHPTHHHLTHSIYLTQNYALSSQNGTLQHHTAHSTHSEPTQIHLHPKTIREPQNYQPSQPHISSTAQQMQHESLGILLSPSCQIEPHVTLVSLDSLANLTPTKEGWRVMLECRGLRKSRESVTFNEFLVFVTVSHSI